MSCLKMSEAAFLAFNALAILAWNGEKMSVGSIARKTESSKFHLSKVMLRLQKAGFVSSSRGPKGGFALALDPEKINLLSVYELIEGPIAEKSCPFDKEKCPFKICLMEKIVVSLTTDFKHYLSSTSLKEFARLET